MPNLRLAGNWKRAKSAALEASRVIKAKRGRLLTLMVYNDSAADQYIQLHNAAALPANGAVPDYVFKVGAGNNGFAEFITTGLDFDTGIVVCNSSTAATKTIGAADCWFLALFD
jgi:hypothetical protein